MPGAAAKKSRDMPPPKSASHVAPADHVALCHRLPLVCTLSLQRQSSNGRRRPSPRPFRAASPHAIAPMVLERGGECWGKVEIAQRLGWPLDPAEQALVLLGIRPWEWDFVIASNLKLLADAGYRPIADHNLATPYGQRRFQVWRAGGHTSAIIVKETCPTPLLVSCALAVSGESIEATFCLMSGAEFNTCAFVLPRPTAALRVFELEDAARTAALQEDLLESRQHEIQLLLHGFSAALPSTTPVWPGGVLTPQALEAHIEHLRAFSAPRA